MIGFIDQSAIQLSPNRRRVLNTDTVTYSESYGKRSRTIFGFMAINGDDVAMVSDTARSYDMCEFLQLVRKENNDKPIIAVMDNARIHKAGSVKEQASELDIEQVFLPPYSPDLNPIEFGWKDMKREISAVLDFDTMVEISKDAALRLFRERKSSYAGYWIESFICTAS